jgi:hypothetical protein
VKAVTWQGLEDVRVENVPEDGAFRVVFQP